jgi:hypothetical protein
MAAATQDNWKRACIHASLLRTYALLAVLFGFVCLYLVVADRGSAESGGRDLAAWLVPAGFFILVGLGAGFGFKVAAVLLSASIGAIGLWLGVGSLMNVSDTAWVLLNVPVALLCFLPLWSTIQGWNALK